MAHTNSCSKILTPVRAYIFWLCHNRRISHMSIQFLRISLVLCSALLCAPHAFGAQSVPLARGIIERRFGKAALRNVELQELAGKPQFDTFEYQAHNGQLTVRGSSPIALSSGFYQFIRRNGLGMTTWAGTRLDRTKGWPETPLTRVSTPYNFRYYFNVVTYGYTMSYWTWERWQQEIDWMALHGINMPLALVGTEAIGERVWKQLGLTQAEIDAHFTGPAYLPWQRMGNINRHNGPYPTSWNGDQVALQHKILGQMRALGMQPIVPGFAGFVPQGLTRIYPDAKIHGTSWGGFGKADSAYLLDAHSPQFANIGKMFVQEWEKEFGKATYFLADSFNEMNLPTTSAEEKNLLLADYGDVIYQSIKAGDPDAVWVIQGWMLGFQRNIWTKDALYALASKVPDDKMLFLDLAADYSTITWRQGHNWDFYSGFAGKTWIYSVIPNMGGKTAWTGNLDYYAKGTSEALNSANKGQLLGSGFAPEGIENNEALYELLSDAWWRNEAINLDDWLATYSRARYGDYPPAMKTAWELMRQSAYGTFTDHPLFNWQNRAQMRGSVNSDARFFQAVEAFLSCAPELKDSPLYRADAIELASIYLSLKAEENFRLAREAQQHNIDSPAVQQVFDHGVQLLSETDRLLSSHPVDRLERWTNFARAHGTTKAQKDYYESDARRIITQWGGGIRDYSGRMWSGLIRDFYIPRLQAERQALLANKQFNFDQWETPWIMASGTSPLAPYANPVQTAQSLVQAAKNWKAPSLPEMTSPFKWKSGQVNETWSEQEWDITAKITRVGTIKAAFFYMSGRHRLDISWVDLRENGKAIARDEHAGTTGTANQDNAYVLKIPAFTAGAKYTLHARVRADGGSDSNGDVVISTEL